MQLVTADAHRSLSSIKYKQDHYCVHTTTEVWFDGYLTLLYLASTFRKFLENHVDLELKEIHQLLVYGDDVKLLNDSLNNKEKHKNIHRG
jgi:hypothetical protein